MRIRILSIVLLLYGALLSIYCNTINTTEGVLITSELRKEIGYFEGLDPVIDLSANPRTQSYWDAYFANASIVALGILRESAAPYGSEVEPRSQSSSGVEWIYAASASTSALPSNQAVGSYSMVTVPTAWLTIDARGFVNVSPIRRDTIGEGRLPGMPPVPGAPQKIYALSKGAITIDGETFPNVYAIIGPGTQPYTRALGAKPNVIELIKTIMIIDGAEIAARLETER